MPLMSSVPNGGLYAITDGPRVDLLLRAAAVLAGGARILQYRDKSNDSARRRDEALALHDLCERSAVPLIINDDVELAAAVGAAGVHLGRDDGDVRAARARLGTQAIIGVSCYDSLANAEDAANAGASYLAFGAFYPSTTKPQTRRASPGLLREAATLGLPIVAIGGITPQNGRALIDAGANFLAVISGLFGVMDSRSEAERYAELFRRRPASVAAEN